jgi:hypothetical protein
VCRCPPRSNRPPRVVGVVVIFISIAIVVGVIVISIAIVVGVIVVGVCS